MLNLGEMWEKVGKKASQAESAKIFVLCLSPFYFLLACLSCGVSRIGPTSSAGVYL